VLSLSQATARQPVPIIYPGNKRARPGHVIEPVARQIATGTDYFLLFPHSESIIRMIDYTICLA